MKIKEISCCASIYEPSELPDNLRPLVEKAKQMTSCARAPYSGFRVGAAIEMADGEIIGGANQENASFPAGMCAERCAAFWAAANRPGVAMRRIAVAAAIDAGFQAEPVSPCGVCRQALLEYEKEFGPIEVVLYGARHIYTLPSVGSLLPLSFTEF